MENAAKALLIAGGILFAILILSLIVYVSNATTRMAEAQEQKKLVEELEAFNKSYEAYNKRRMYGADVITVVKKAIDYNKSLSDTQKDKAINITITVEDNFETTVQEVTTYKKNGEVKKGNLKTISDTSLIGTGESKILKVDYNTKYTDKVVTFFAQSTEDFRTIKKDTSDELKEIVTYTALANFKRAIFTCEECEDTNKDGRIDYMRFKQYMTLEDMDKK